MIILADNYDKLILRRVYAFLIDFFIILLVDIEYHFIVLIDDPSEVYLAFAPALLIYAYFIMMDSYFKGTIGKKLLKLQVTNHDMSNISIYESLKRNSLVALIFYTGALGFIYAFAEYGSMVNLHTTEISNIQSKYGSWYVTLRYALIWTIIIHMIIALGRGSKKSFPHDHWSKSIITKKKE